MGISHHPSGSATSDESIFRILLWIFVLLSLSQRIACIYKFDSRKGWGWKKKLISSLILMETQNAGIRIQHQSHFACTTTTIVALLPPLFLSFIAIISSSFSFLCNVKQRSRRRSKKDTFFMFPFLSPPSPPYLMFSGSRYFQPSISYNPLPHTHTHTHIDIQGRQSLSPFSRVEMIFHAFRMWETLFITSPSLFSSPPSTMSHSSFHGVNSYKIIISLIPG